MLSNSNSNSNAQFIINSIKSFSAYNKFNNVDRATLGLHWARHNIANMPSEQFGGPLHQPIFKATINSLVNKRIIVCITKKRKTYYSIA